VVTQAPRKSAVAIALAFTLSCVLLITFVWVQFGGTIPFAPQSYRVKAVFNETGLLVSNADIRIAGVNVGRVAKVQAQGTHSLVTMNIASQYAPIPADTRAILREKTLLGEGYVELSSGSRAGPKLRDGGTIPVSQVAATQQLDQVLNSFTTPVQHDLQSLLIGTGNALAGRGEDLNDAFGNFDPAATELQAIVGVLQQQQGNLRSLINNSTTVLGTLADRGADIRSLIHSGNAVFASTAAENKSLEATVHALPPFLRQLKTSLGVINNTMQLAKPSLAVLTPVAPLFKPALEGLSNAAGPLIGVLKQAPGTLRVALKALPYVGRFLTDLKPAVNAILPAAEQVVPMINIASDYKSTIVTAMVELAAMLQAQANANTTQPVAGTPAGEAHYLRAEFGFGPDSFWGATKVNVLERSNAYYSPGELGQIADGGLEAATCKGAATGNGNVPCKLQPSYPWGHGVLSSYYPHVTAAKP
jgi:phospholipid/cholesterol/gamma-HCH transport system substrate-binding protein